MPLDKLDNNEAKAALDVNGRVNEDAAAAEDEADGAVEDDRAEGSDDRSVLGARQAARVTGGGDEATGAPSRVGCWSSRKEEEADGWREREGMDEEEDEEAEGAAAAAAVKEALPGRSGETAILKCE